MPYADAVIALSRQVTIRATMTLADATVINLTGAHIITYSINEGGSFIPLGTVASASFTLELVNAAGEWFKGGSMVGIKSLMGAKVFVEIGVYFDGAYNYVAAGEWYVNKPAGREGGRFALRGNDKLMTAYEEIFVDGQTYPRTLQQVYDYIKTKGITITGTLACNAAASIAVKPDWGKDCSLRLALGYVAQMGGCFVRVNRSGALEMIATKSIATPRAIGPSVYIELDNQNTYFSFNRVKIMPRGAVVETVYVEGVVNAGTPEANNNTLVISDNPLFMLGAANLQTMATALATALSGYQLELMVFRWRGDPLLQIGDIVALTDRRAVTTTTYVIQQNLRFDNGMTADISCQLSLETMLPSYISPNGTISPAAFGKGTLDPNVLIAHSITALQIAAHTLTAEEIAAGTLDVQDASITTAKIVNLAVTSGKIADLAVVAAKIALATITSAQIAAAAIETANIKDLAVVTGKIADLAVVTAKIALLAVDSGQIKDAAIINAKIGDLAVNTAKIADLAVTTAKIAALAVDSAKIGLLAVNEAHIQDGSIENAKIADAAISQAKIADLSVGMAQIIDGSILTAHIADAQITAAKIALLAVGMANIQDASITNAMILAGAVGTAQIEDGSITDAKIVTLTANKINAGELSVERLIISGSDQSIVFALNNMGALVSQVYDTINGDTLTPRTITADKIVAKTITAAEIAAQTITANEILALSITAEQLAASAVTAAKIAAGIITVDKLAANVGSLLDLSSNTGINARVTALNTLIAAKANQSAIDGLATSEYVNTRFVTELSVLDGTITNKFTEAKQTGIDAATGLATFKGTVESWQQFSPDGLILGKSGSPFQVWLSNDRLSFKQDGVEIAYMVGNKLYITASEIVNQFVIGNDVDGYITLDSMDDGLTATRRTA